MALDAQSLTKQGVSESLIARLDEVKDNHHGISGRAGRAIVATSEAVLIDDILLEPAGSTIATLGELPYLIPLIAHGYDTEPFLIAKVDHTGADLCVRDARGRDVYGETVDGDGFPVHRHTWAVRAIHRQPKPRGGEYPEEPDSGCGARGGTRP